MGSSLSPAAVLLLIAPALAACSEQTMVLRSVLAQEASLELRAPRLELEGRCEQDFSQRFCADEYETIGVIDIAPGEERRITVSGVTSSDQCTDLVWMRLVRLEEVGPIDDPGTVIQLPAEVELEQGAGQKHTVAFPQGTVRIDELGPEDANQGAHPPGCS